MQVTPENGHGSIIIKTFHPKLEMDDCQEYIIGAKPASLVKSGGRGGGGGSG